MNLPIVCTAQEIQMKQEEGRDSELEKTKITVSYSFHPFLDH